MKSNLLNFICTHKDWRELLSGPPCNIEIKEDGDYILLKYNQLESDFSILLVQECRGCIIKKDEIQLDWTEPPKYHFVCRPFDKFFNYGEEYAANIDWTTALVTEKVDGSLIKVWWDRDDFNKGHWHVSTNGTIDAFKCNVADSDLTFGDLFFRIFGFKDNEDFQYFFSRFDKRCTYMFELTSPESRVVINYHDGLYLLAVRYNDNGNYTFWHFGEVLDLLSNPKIHNVKVYKLKTLSECLDVVSKMTMDEEGVVVCDKNNNRIKIKSPEYLFRAKLYGMGVKSDEALLDIILQGKDDDLLAYCPEYKERINSIKNCIKKYEERCYFLWNLKKHILYSNKLDGRKEFALAIKDCPEKSFLFAKADNKLKEPLEYLKRISLTNSIKLLRNYDTEYTEHE